METANNPEKMAKWADKTETIVNQINEAKEQVGRITDKAIFILTTSLPLNEAPPQLKEAQEVEQPDGNEGDSALSRKLDELIGYLVGLNDQLGTLCDRIDV